MPVYPGYPVGDHDYPDPDEPTAYYNGPDDEDDDPGWAGAEYADDEYLDAEDDDSGELAEDDDSEWADEEGYGPGPGRGYPHADASHLGWAR
jgi:hypothetical protein